MIAQLLLVLIILNFITVYILLDEQQQRSHYLKKKIFVLWLSIGAILLGVASLINYPIIKTILMVILNIGFGYGAFHHKQTALVRDGFFALTIGVCELSILPIVQVMSQYFVMNQANTIWYITCSLLFVQLIIFYVYHIYQKMRNHHQKEENTGFAILNFILLPIFSFINIMVISTISQFYMYSWIVVALTLDIMFVIYLNIYLSYVYHTMMESNRLKKEVALYEQKSTLQFDYYQKLEENYQKSRQLIHDVKRHLQMIKTEQEDTKYKEDFQLYLNQYAMPVYSNHRLLNMILYEKTQEAKKTNILLTCETSLLDLSFMKDIDITTIFLNLFDNAIDACLDCDSERWILLKADTVRDFLVIEISNSIKNIPSTLKTSNKKHHEGLGLRNVEQALESYGGNMQIDFNENEFHVNLYLPMK